MMGSQRPATSNRLLLLFPAVSVTTLSIAAMAYRWFWHRRETEGNPRSRSRYDTETGDDGPAARILRPPLRHSRPPRGEKPRVVYLTGIDKQTSGEELLDLFSSCGAGPPLEVDASELSFARGGGRAWAKYGSQEAAAKAVAALHGRALRGCVLCARPEWGVEGDGKRITDPATHTAIVRGIRQRRGTPRKKDPLPLAPGGGRRGGKKKRGNGSEGRGNGGGPAVTYAHNAIFLREMEYPFPSGVYATKLIQRLSALIEKGPTPFEEENSSSSRHRREQDAKLLRMLSDVSILGCGSAHRYAKEISEAFGMVDALERGIKLAFRCNSSDLDMRIVCYCLGDGKLPVGAAALELFLKKNDESDWKFIAIDPLLPKQYSPPAETPTSTAVGVAKTNETTSYHDRIELFSGCSQDYSIEETTKQPPPRNGDGIGVGGESTSEIPRLLSIAIACHSHAPLEEFWERMPTPKLCVAMPCCAQFSELPKETPILEYDNYEVYSPKRRIKIFASL